MAIFISKRLLKERWLTQNFVYLFDSLRIYILLYDKLSEKCTETININSYAKYSKIQNFFIQNISRSKRKFIRFQT